MTSRRASLPGAAELFRATSPASAEATPTPTPHPGVGAIAPTVAPRPGRPMRAVADRGPSGRERHDEKITVYCSPDELVDLESARLALRAEHGLAIDRGRIVREAIAVVLADLEAKGAASILVRRLRQ
jgi:hypothetical protein